MLLRSAVLQVQGRISYRQDAERPVGAGVTVEPASAALAEGLLEDYDRVVYEGEDFEPLRPRQVAEPCVVTVQQQ